MGKPKKMIDEPSDEVVERVAQAIFEAWPHLSVGITRREWKSVGPNDCHATWYPLARAAIAAMPPSDREIRLEEALERIAVASEFHAQDGISDYTRRYAHESTYRLARAVLAKEQADG